MFLDLEGNAQVIAVLLHQHTFSCFWVWRVMPRSLKALGAAAPAHILIFLILESNAQVTGGLRHCCIGTHRHLRLGVSLSNQ